MPSTMIHLLVAHTVEPEPDGLFLVGSFAPDYTNVRELKDRIHLRDVRDRLTALDELRRGIDMSNAFERGWLLHLFTDLCWDTTQLDTYRVFHENAGREGNWFPAYRNEIGYATYWLHHHMPWAADAWEKIRAVDIAKIRTTLPFDVDGGLLYRDRVVRKHAESDPASVPELFTPELISAFVGETVDRYVDWMK